VVKAMDYFLRRQDGLDKLLLLLLLTRRANTSIVWTATAAASTPHAASAAKTLHAFQPLPVRRGQRRRHFNKVSRVVIVVTLRFVVGGKQELPLLGQGFHGGSFRHG
jgi:hypothetical protein